MGRARDPTVDMANLQAAERSWATVAAHLEALGSAGDCGAELTDDVTLTIMETGEVIHGRAAVAALLTYVHRLAFSAPPVVMTLVAGAERAMIEAEFAGQHLGEFAGILPTGRVVRLPYVVAYDLDANTDIIRAMRLYFPLDMLVRQLRET
jgi:predicted ester cyclase